MGVKFNPFSSTLDVVDSPSGDFADVELNQGTAAAPSISFNGDPNTGIYSPGADQVAISTNGTGRLFVDANGKLGVGTSSPSQQLHVTSASNTTALIAGGGTGYAQLKLTGGSTENYIDSDDSLQFSIGGNTKATLTSTGLGIGTTSPIVPLHIYHPTTNGVATFESGDADALINFKDNATTNSPSVGATGNDFKIITSSTERLRITSTGTLMHLGAGNSTTPAVQFNGSAPVNSLVMDSSGKVGLGTSTPSFTTGTGLHIAAVNAALKLQSTGDTGWAYAEFADETNTTRYILGYRDTGNTFGIKPGNALNAASGITVDSSGNVGIGTTSPSYQLDVRNPITPGESWVRVDTASATNDCGFRFAHAGTNHFVIGHSGTGDYLQFYDNIANAERMRIDSSGRLLVGTSSSGSILTKTIELHNAGTGVNQPSYDVYANISTSTDQAGRFSFYRSRGTSVGSFDTVVSGNDLGFIYWSGADGSKYVPAATIRCQVDGTPGTDDMPGRLVFSTTADGSSSPTARATIDSSGRLLVGTSSASGVGLLQVEGQPADSTLAGVIDIRRGSTNPSSGTDVGYIRFGDSAENFAAQISCISDGTWGSGDYPGRLVFSTTADGASSPTERMRIDSVGKTNFYRNTATTTSQIISGQSDVGGTASTVFYVRANGGIGNYQSNNVDLSDAREKRNVQDAPATWDCLKNWEIVEFNYVADSVDESPRFGVIAQQVQQHCPEVVIPYQEAEEAIYDVDGAVVVPAKEERLGVREQQMMWMAIKALQEAQLRIETLEAEVAALKGA